MSTPPLKEIISRSPFLPTDWFRVRRPGPEDRRPATAVVPSTGEAPKHGLLPGPADGRTQETQAGVQPAALAVLRRRRTAAMPAVSPHMASITQVLGSGTGANSTVKP